MASWPDCLKLPGQGYPESAAGGRSDEFTQRLMDELAESRKQQALMLEALKESANKQRKQQKRSKKRKKDKKKKKKARKHKKKAKKASKRKDQKNDTED